MKKCLETTNRTIQMQGRKFGRLTVLELTGKRVSNRHPSWKCLCDCGNESVKTGIALRNGIEPSCGCAIKDFQRKKHNLAGQRFGRLIVLEAESLSNLKRHIIWNCVCDCGKTKKTSGADLRNGHTKSCGCLHLDTVAELSTTHGHTKSKNRSQTYGSWAAMLTRCSNKNAMNYKYYGGRGIIVCENWKKFEIFLKDMGERPFGMSIDRIDVNGNYEFNNCKWSTASEQAANKRKQTNGQQ